MAQDYLFNDQDLAIDCRAARAPNWLIRSGLQETKGFVQVNEKLKTSDAAVFASGDCAQRADSPFPRAGVYAVREAPILAENLRRTLLEDSELLDFHPQRNHLILMPSDRQRALAIKGRWVSGPWGFWLKTKDWIDHRFMQSFAKENL